MIRWLIQNVAEHPDLSLGHPPEGLLTPAELAHYQAFLSPRRRRDWLLGRWTAKQLVQAHIEAMHGFRSALDAFSIAYEASGAPYMATSHTAMRGTLLNACQDGRIPVELSISHSNGYAFCALAENSSGEVRIGADIELVEARPERFAKDFFTPAEQRTILAAPPEMHELLITATWNAKEATLKATHHALRVDPRSVECIVRPARPRHWTPFHLQMESALRSQLGIIAPKRAWWRVIDNRLRPGTAFVMTLVAFGAAL